MTDPVVVALITAIASVLGVGIGAWNTRKIAVVHDAVNGGLDEAKKELRESKALLTAALLKIESLEAAAKDKF